MLDDKTVGLAQGKNFAVVSTVMKSGHPQTQMMWVDSDGEHIIFNTEIHRAKFKNLERDPKVTVMVVEDGNPWNYSEVRGHVVETIRGPEARAHIDSLGQEVPGGGRLSQSHPVRARHREGGSGPSLHLPAFLTPVSSPGRPAGILP